MRYLTYIPQLLCRSASRALKEQEKLWIVSLLWGVALWWSAFVIGGITFNIGFVGWGSLRFIPPIIHMVVFILGLIFIFIYPFCLATALIRCFRNTPHVGLSILFAAIGWLQLTHHVIAGIWIFLATLSHYHVAKDQFAIIFGVKAS